MSMSVQRAAKDPMDSLLEDRAMMAKLGTKYVLYLTTQDMGGFSTPFDETEDRDKARVFLEKNCEEIMSGLERPYPLKLYNTLNPFKKFLDECKRDHVYLFFTAFPFGPESRSHWRDGLKKGLAGNHLDMTFLYGATTLNYIYAVIGLKNTRNNGVISPQGIGRLISTQFRVGETKVRHVPTISVNDIVLLPIALAHVGSLRVSNNFPRDFFNYNNGDIGAVDAGRIAEMMRVLSFPRQIRQMSAANTGGTQQDKGAREHFKNLAAHAAFYDLEIPKAHSQDAPWSSTDYWAKAASCFVQTKRESTKGPSGLPHTWLYARVKEFVEEYPNMHNGVEACFYFATKEDPPFNKSTIVHFILMFSEQVLLLGEGGLRRRVQDLVVGSMGCCLISFAPLDLSPHDDGNLLAQAVLAWHDPRPSPARDQLWARMKAGVNGHVPIPAPSPPVFGSGLPQPPVFEAGAGPSSSSPVMFGAGARAPSLGRGLSGSRAPSLGRAPSSMSLSSDSRTPTLIGPVSSSQQPSPVGPGPNLRLPTPAFAPSFAPTDPRLNGFRAGTAPSHAKTRSSPPPRSRSRSPVRDRQGAWSHEPMSRAEGPAPMAKGLLQSACMGVVQCIPLHDGALDKVMDAMILHFPEWIDMVRSAKKTIQRPRVHDERPDLTVLENSLTYLLLVLADGLLPCALALLHASISVVRMLEAEKDLARPLLEDLRRAHMCATGFAPVIKGFISVDLSQEKSLADWSGMQPFSGGGEKPEWSPEIQRTFDPVPATNFIKKIYLHMYEAHLLMLAMMPENGVHVRWDRISDIMERVKQELQAAVQEASSLVEAMGSNGSR